MKEAGRLAGSALSPDLRGPIGESKIVTTANTHTAPEQMYESAVELGTEKAESPVFRTFVLAIQAGLQVRARGHTMLLSKVVKIDKQTHVYKGWHRSGHGGRYARRSAGSHRLQPRSSQALVRCGGVAVRPAYDSGHGALASTIMDRSNVLVIY